MIRLIPIVFIYLYLIIITQFCIYVNTQRHNRSIICWFILYKATPQSLYHNLLTSGKLHSLLADMRKSASTTFLNVVISKRKWLTMRSKNVVKSVSESTKKDVPVVEMPRDERSKERKNFPVILRLISLRGRATASSDNLQSIDCIRNRIVL